MKTTMQTPWGTAQTIHTLADGIVSVTTASHGGIRVSPERMELIPEDLRRGCIEWSDGTGWFEEDCMWAVVYDTFPECFSESAAEGAECAINWLFPDRESYTTCSINEKVRANGRKSRQRRHDAIDTRGVDIHDLNEVKTAADGTLYINV